MPIGGISRGLLAKGFVTCKAKQEGSRGGIECRTQGRGVDSNAQLFRRDRSNYKENRFIAKIADDNPPPVGCFVLQ